MVLIVGGAYHGKKQFILNYFKETDIFDARTDDIAKIANFPVIYNAHKLEIEFLKNNLELLKGKIVIGNEIGLGIVPVDINDRIRRDEVGRAYQKLTKMSPIVIRIWYMIPIYIKSNESKFKEFAKEIRS